MQNDFRKFATKHLGMNGMVLDDVITSQAQYLNPYMGTEESPAQCPPSGFRIR